MSASYAPTLESIRPDEARRFWKGSKQMRVKLLMDEEAAIDREVHDLAEEQRELLQDLHLLQKRDLERLALVTSRHEQKREDLKAKAFELEEFLVETRNSTVTAELQGLYRDKIPRGDLQVFCVSNMDYRAKRLWSRAEALPWLRLCGIPAVRTHCLSMVTDARLRITWQYVGDDITTLLGDVALWVESGAGGRAEEQKKVIREALDAVEESLQMDLVEFDSPLLKISKMMKTDFNGFLYNTRSRDKWARSALRAAQMWHGWAPASYSAFCRKYGDHVTMVAKRHNWNEEAMVSMVKDLKILWPALRAKLTGERTETEAFVENVLNRATEHLATKLRRVPGSTDTLRKTLRARKNALITGVKVLGAKFEKDLPEMEMDALSGVRTSFIGVAMESSYNATNQCGGTGSDAVRKSIIEGAFGKRQLFENIMWMFQEQFNEAADRYEEGVVALAEEYLDGVESTFNMIRSKNVATESRQDLEFRHRVETCLRTVGVEANQLAQQIADGP